MIRDPLRRVMRVSNMFVFDLSTQKVGKRGTGVVIETTADRSSPEVEKKIGVSQYRLPSRSG